MRAGKRIIIIWLIICLIGCVNPSAKTGKPTNGLEGTIKSNKMEYKEGEDVIIDFTLKNISDKPIRIFERMENKGYLFHILSFAQDKQMKSFVKVYKRGISDSPVFRTIEPGKKYTIQLNPTGKGEQSGDWKIELEPGTYRVEGIYGYNKDSFFGDQGVWCGGLRTNGINIKIIE
jgi:hypothetical protein